MQNKHKHFILSVCLMITILFTACEDEKPGTTAKDHIDLARLYFKQGSFKASLIEGKNALRLEPENIDALKTMTEVLIELSDGSGASNLIKKAIDINKNDQNLKLLLVKSHITDGKIISAQTVFDDINSEKIEDLSNYLVLKGDMLLISNKINDAKKAYVDAYNNNSKNVHAILGIAKTSLILKQPEEVDKYTTLAIETAPTDTNTLLWQARVYMLKQKYIDAENFLFRTMIELERNDTMTANKYATIDLLIKVLVAQGKIEESMQYSNYLSQTQAGKIQSSYTDALNLVSQGGDLTEAEKAFQELLEQAPRHKPSGIILGLINFEKGDYIKADDYLSQFANDENSPLRSKKILALTKIKLNKSDEALDIILDSIKHYPEDADLYALSGLAYLNKNDAGKSIKAFTKAIRLSSKKSAYYTNLAKAYLLNKNTKQAIESAILATKLEPKSEDAVLTLIGSYAADKQFHKAKSLTMDWLKQNPNHVQALIVSASLELQTQNKEKSRTLFLKALTQDPSNLTANMYMARFDVIDNNQYRAIERLGLILNKHPENLPALNMLFSLSQNKLYTDNIILLLNTIIKKNKFTVNSRLVLAQIYLNTKQPDNTLLLIDALTKIDNKNSRAYLLKAKAFLAKKKIQDAIDTYQLVSSLDPNSPTAQTELAQVYLQLNNHEQAIHSAKNAIKINDNYLPAHTILTKAYIETGNNKQALNAINIIREKNPISSLSDELEADYYINMKNYSIAISKLNSAWSKQQTIYLASKLRKVYQLNDQANLSFQAWEELANKDKNNLTLQLSYSLELQQAKQFKKTQQVLEHLLLLAPDNPVVLNNLANVYLELNDKRALSIAKKALLQQPGNPAILDTVGWIYIKLNKDYTQGLSLLRQAYEKSHDPEIKQHLITALSDAGHTSEASLLIDK